MDSAFEYHARHDALETARIFRLDSTGLMITEAGLPPIVLRFAEVTRIRLRFSPTRVQTNRFQCQISAAGREIEFSNEFYQGLANFADRSAEYRRFVTTLCATAAAANPRVEFIAGREAWVLRLEGAFLILMALLLGWILLLTGGLFNWLILAKLGLIAFFLPTLIRYFKRSRPMRFDPAAVPEGVLPRAEDARA